MKFTDRLNKIIGGEPSTSTSQFTPALNNIRGGDKMLQKMKKTPDKALMKKPAIKQYGDKGYKPSNGIGVGM